MSASAALPSPFSLPIADGKTRPVLALDIQRLTLRSALPRGVKLIIFALNTAMDDPYQVDRPVSMAQLAAETGYSTRHLQRLIVIAEELGVLRRKLQGYAKSTFTLNLSRIYDLHRRFVLLGKLRNEATRTWAQRAAEAMAAGIRFFTPHVPPIPAIAQDVIGHENAQRLGWTPRRCWRLWKENGRPSTAAWAGFWALLMEQGLAKHPGPPDWLWNAKQWKAKVDACKRHDDDGGPAHVTPVHGAEMAFPRGTKIRIHSPRNWQPETNPARALELLKRADAQLLLGGMPIATGYTDRGYLEITVDDPRLLAMAEELAEHLRESMPGPIVLTW